jgi:hypothetical protein
MFPAGAQRAVAVRQRAVGLCLCVTVCACVCVCWWVVRLMMGLYLRLFIYPQACDTGLHR